MAIRGAVAMVQEDGSKVLRVRDAPGVEWREVGVWPQEETGNFHRFTQDGKGIYAESSKAHGAGEASDTTRLVVLSAADGSELRMVLPPSSPAPAPAPAAPAPATAPAEIAGAVRGMFGVQVHHDVRCDIDDVLFGEDDNQVEAVLVDFQRQEWVVKHERVKVGGRRACCSRNAPPGCGAALAAPPWRPDVCRCTGAGGLCGARGAVQGQLGHRLAGPRGRDVDRQRPRRQRLAALLPLLACDQDRHPSLPRPPRAREVHARPHAGTRTPQPRRLCQKANFVPFSSARKWKS